MIFQRKKLPLQNRLCGFIDLSGKITVACLCLQVIFLICIAATSVGFAAGNEILEKGVADQKVQMITPENNGLVHGKKPVIECIINVPFDKETLYVEFDMTDVSQLIKLDNNRLWFKPVQVVQPGNHQFTVSFTTLTGEQVAEMFQFSSRHSKLFETAYSRNTVSGGYTKVLKKYQDAKNREMTEWKAEAILGTDNFLAQGPWSFNFKADGIYYDQANPNEVPIEDTLELANFLFTGKYEQNKYMFETSIGDVVVDESRNTVNYLSKRGGKFVAEYGVAGFSGFVVRSDQIYGSDGDYGLELDNDDHILGVSGDLDLFKNRANIKAIYVTGGTQPEDESFGIWDQIGGTKGDVSGIVVKTDFFQQKFATSFEFDRSNYDPDTSDNISSKSDKAYYLKADGTIKRLSYQAEYEYTGFDFQVPGNSIRSDWEGYKFRSDLRFDKHTFGASYSKYNDDVEKTSFNGRTCYTDYEFNYDLNIFPNAPVTFAWLRGIAENKISIVDSFTDTYSSSISLMKDSSSIFFRTAYAKTNDQTIDDYDSSDLDLNLSVVYSKEKFSLQPAIGFNRNKDYSTDVYRDTDSCSLTFTVNIMENLCINNTGSFSHTTASDNLVDEDCYINDFQLTYNYPDRIWGIFSPAASLLASYVRTEDGIMGTKTEETIVYVTLSGEFEISF